MKVQMRQAGCEHCHHLHHDWKGAICRLYNDYPTEEDIVEGCDYWELRDVNKRINKWN
jgi:hypothetical protein